MVSYTAQVEQQNEELQKRLADTEKVNDKIQPFEPIWFVDEHESITYYGTCIYKIARLKWCGPARGWHAIFLINENESSEGKTAPAFFKSLNEAKTAIEEIVMHILKEHKDGKWQSLH